MIHYLNNSGLYLNSTEHRKVVINFIKKMKILSKNRWFLDSFCYSTDNYVQTTTHKQLRRFNWDSFYCKAEQSIRGIVLQEKEAQKD